MSEPEEVEGVQRKGTNALIHNGLETIDISRVSKKLVDYVRLLFLFALNKPSTQTSFEQALKSLLQKTEEAMGEDESFLFQDQPIMDEQNRLLGFDDWCDDDMEIKNCFVSCPDQEEALGFLIRASDETSLGKKQASDCYNEAVMLSLVEKQMHEAISLNKEERFLDIEQGAGSQVLNLNSASFNEKLEQFHSDIIQIDNDKVRSPEQPM